MTPVSRSTASEMWKSGRSPASSVVRGMVALEQDRLATGDDDRAGHRAAAGRQHVLAIPGRMDEGIGQGLGRQRRDRLVDLRRAREVVIVEAARPVPDRSLGAQPMDARVGSDEVAVRDPDLVLSADAFARLHRGDPRIARMAQDGVHRHQVLAARRAGAFLDPQAQRSEASLGVAHEVEQLGDRRQLAAEGDHLGQSAAINGGRDHGGAIPESAVGHRADCSGRSGWDVSPRPGLRPGRARSSRPGRGGDPGPPGPCRAPGPAHGWSAPT